MTRPILVSGAAGRVGGVGGLVVQALQRRGVPVRAKVRSEAERAEVLRATGPEFVVGDLTRGIHSKGGKRVASRKIRLGGAR